MSWESKGVSMLMSQDGGYDGIRIKPLMCMMSIVLQVLYSQISRYLPICFLKSAILLRHSAVSNLETLKSLTWKWINVWFQKSVHFQDVKSEVRVIAVEVKAFVMTMVPAFVISGQAHWCWQQDKLLWMILREQICIPWQSLQEDIEIWEFLSECPNAVVNVDHPPEKKHFSFRRTCDDSSTHTSKLEQI